MKVTAPHIGLLAVLSIMAGCSGSGGDNDTATTDNTVDNSTGKLTISGLVTDDPIVNADIMFKVGNVEFPSEIPTGSLGDYQVEIESDDPNALVVGSAYDAANNVRLTAVLDSFEGCLDLAQNSVVNNVKITNITTAQQVLAERIALDGKIDDFEEYVELLPQIDAGELLELSSAIKVVVENIGGTILPNGSGDTLELARAIADGSSSFLSDLELVSPGSLQQAQDKLMSDGNATIKFSAPQAAGVYSGAGNEFIYAVFDNGSALAEFFDDSAIPGTPSWQITKDGKLRVNFYGFDRQADDLTLMSETGDTLHLVSQSVGSAEQVAATVSRYDFGTPFDASTVVGTFSDPRNAENDLVIQEGGVGYSAAQNSAIQNPFTWEINENGSLGLNFSNNGLSLELINLQSDTDATVLGITRFDGQWPTLVVGNL